LDEPTGTTSNYWLNAVLMRDRKERDAFLKTCTDAGIQARPAWELATDQPMYIGSIRGELPISRELQDRLVNIPSSAHP
jgi:dTDP-4-amino-4,6-dideoxygalactose transaminase